MAASVIRAVSSATKPVILARDPAHNLAASGEIDTNTTSLDLHLQPGLTLSGEVRDSDGRQVTNAIVKLMPFPPDDKRSNLNQMPPTNASPEGLYFFSALPQGIPYRVNVSAVGLRFQQRHQRRPPTRRRKNSDSPPWFLNSPTSNSPDR